MSSLSMPASSLLLVALALIATQSQAQDQQPPPKEDPATSIANVMAGVAFASRCGAITNDEAGAAARIIMVYGMRHGIEPTKSGEIGKAAVEATAKMPDYVFTDSLCSLYATGIHNLINRFDK